MIKTCTAQHSAVQVGRSVCVAAAFVNQEKVRPSGAIHSPQHDPFLSLSTSQPSSQPSSFPTG